MPGHAARAAARLALDRHAHLERAPRAGHDLGERELHQRLGVGAASRAGRAAAAEHVAAEERVEEIVEAERARRERVAGRAAPPPSGPNMSYWRRRSGSRTVSYAALISLKRSAALGIVGVRVGVALAREPRGTPS